jgi:hypothetical protein
MPRPFLLIFWSGLLAWKAEMVPLNLGSVFILQDAQKTLADHHTTPIHQERHY